MPGVGESAPYQEMYQHFGIAAEAIVKAAKKRGISLYFTLFIMKAAPEISGVA